MNTGMTVRDLVMASFTEPEARAALSCGGMEQIRLLRRGRSRLLEDIHSKQQALDRLDYFIYRLRQRETKPDGSD